jgi:Flp pilus assembly protein TadD
LGLAASYDRLARFDLAERSYERAARLGGRSPEYLNNLGYHYLLRGDRKRARALFNEALALDPNNAVLQGNLKLVDQWKASEPL